MDRDQFDNAHGTERKAHEEERIDEGELGYFRQARRYRKQKGDLCEDGGQGDRYLSIIVAGLYPES